MKTFKKLTAMAVALVFVFTSLVGATAFAEDDSIFSDVSETNSYYEAITSLVADGVINGYEDGTFKPDATITRAEFSKLLAVGSTPAGTVFSQTSTQFSDVADSTSSSAWAIPYIAHAVGIKAINGYEDGTFRPTNPVTYGCAVKMIVCTLGYGPVVDTTLTPWYQGYIDIAFKIGLTKNAFAQGDTPAPRALVAQLIYNMQSCKVYVPSPDGNSGSTNNWGSDSGLTNEETEDGILLGVFDYCLDGTTITKSQVLIDDEIYQIGDLDRDTLKELVGYAVTFKYTNTRKPELTRVSKSSSENEVITVEDWQIAEVGSKTFEYYADEDDYDDVIISKLTLSDDLYVVYNGVIVDSSDVDADFIQEYLNVENGKIKFISNDGSDKDAEVAIVESYLTYFVSSVSTSKGITTFYDKYSKYTELEPMALDSDEVASVQKVTTKGGKLNDSTLTGVTAKSVTCVAVPYGTKEGTSVIVSTVNFTGTVKEKSSNYKTVKIGNESYEVSPYFEMLVDNGEDVEFSVGDTGKFYLDYLGRIVFYEKTESANPYALLVHYKKTSGLNASYALGICNSSKDVTTFLIGEEVKVNGSKCTAEEAIALLTDSAPAYDEENEKVIIQPIKYKSSTNSNGDKIITEIECMDSDDYSDGNIVPYEFVNSKRTEAAPFADGGTLKFSNSGYAFKKDSAPQFRMNSSTVVYMVPATVTETSKYTKKTYKSFNDGTSYAVEAYDVEGEIAKLVVCYGASTKPSILGSTPTYLVQEINDTYVDGVAGKEIVYYKAGTSETSKAPVADETEVLEIVEDLNPGDIIKFVSDGGEIVDIDKVFVGGKLLNEAGTYKVDGHHISKAYNSKTDYYQVVYGTVREIDVEEKSISMIPGLATDSDFKYENYLTNAITDSTAYYKFDDENGFEVVGAGELEGKGYSDFVDADEDGTVAKENAAQIVAIVVDGDIVAVYILGE